MLHILNVISQWSIPVMLVGIITFGLVHKVPIYESFVEGAKEGLNTALRIIPYLVAMLVAIQIFRQSGALDGFVSFLAPVTERFGIPREIMPLALIRPLSGSGALGVLSQILESYGPDSFIGRLASTIQGSTETTFYVLTVYTGAIGVKKVRHSLAVGLLSDLAGFLASVFIVLYVFGR